MDKNKTCNTCQETKSVELFYHIDSILTKSKGYRSPFCKSCHQDTCTKYKIEHQNYSRQENQQKKYIKNNKWRLELKNGVQSRKEYQKEYQKEYAKKNKGNRI